jgi:hypothetical protein
MNKLEDACGLKTDQEMKISTDQLFWKSCKHGGSRYSKSLSSGVLDEFFVTLLHG